MPSHFRYLPRLGRQSWPGRHEGSCVWLPGGGPRSQIGHTGHTSLPGSLEATGDEMKRGPRQPLRATQWPWEADRTPARQFTAAPLTPTCMWEGRGI